MSTGEIQTTINNVPKRLSHITPTYIIDKVRLLWYEWRNPEAPWLAPEANAFLEKFLRDSDCGVEYGSGRSTVWLGKRVRALLSVEDDLGYYERILADIRESNLEEKVRLEFSDCRADYTSYLSEFSDETVDFCLVDGDARDQVSLVAVPKLRRGGLLILDNANWYLPNPCARAPDSVRHVKEIPSANWEQFHELTSHWRQLWFSSGVSDTLVLIKP